MAKLLLKRGAKINERDEDGFTALHIAASEGHQNLTKLFLQHGAKVNAKDGTGGTALHSACAWNQKAIAELLIDQGADINATDKEGCSPIFLQSCTDIMTWLRFSYKKELLSPFGMEKANPLSPSRVKLGNRTF